MTYKRLPVITALLCWGAGLCFPWMLKAQQARLITLEEAVSLAVAHSTQAALDSTAWMIARSRERQNREQSLPQLSVAGNYLRISDNITPFKVAFPDGEVTLNPQILDQFYTSAQVRQQVWAGGRRRHATRIASLEAQARTFDVQLAKNDAAYAAQWVWYQWFVARQTQKIVAANVQLLQQQARDSRNLVEQGILLSNEALKIELAITRLSAELSDVNFGIDALKRQLALLTGLGLEQTNLIDLPAGLPPSQPDVSLESCFQTAIGNRAELRRLKVVRQQSGVGLSLARAGYYPGISIGGAYNYDKPNQRLFPNRATFTGTWNAGVTLVWNLTDIYTNAEKTRESRLAMKQSDQALNHATEGILLEVNADYTGWLKAQQRIALARKGLEQASENFRVEQNRFSTNTATATDLLNANTLLLQAEIDLAAAQANAQLAREKLNRTTHAKNF